jgi:hypothetical protein
MDVETHPARNRRRQAAENHAANFIFIVTLLRGYIYAGHTAGAVY